MLELLIVISVLLFALLSMSRSLVASMKLNESNKVTAIATDGIREMIETLQGVEEFGDLFAMYNADPDDDPPDVVCPGSGFDVPGLVAAVDDPDGFVGEIVFPAVGTQLLENIVDEDMGMPRDLDGNGEIDDDPKNGTYRLLPVVLRMRWEDSTGEGTLEVSTLIADR